MTRIHSFRLNQFRQRRAKKARFVSSSLIHIVHACTRYIRNTRIAVKRCRRSATGSILYDPPRISHRNGNLSTRRYDYQLQNNTNTTADKFTLWRSSSKRFNSKLLKHCYRNSNKQTNKQTSFSNTVNKLDIIQIRTIHAKIMHPTRD